MFNKQLKPLNHKKVSNGSQPSIKKEPLVKESARETVRRAPGDTKRPSIANKTSTEEAIKSVKYKRSG